MATRKRTTSETGAYMSQYDQEVEKRLESIEAKLQEFADQKNVEVSQSPSSDVEGRIAGIESKLETLISVLKKTPSLNIEKLSNHSL